jgi:hypothetical protein
MISIISFAVMVSPSMDEPLYPPTIHIGTSLIKLHLKNAFEIMQMLENYLFFDTLNAISIIERVYFHS